MGDTGVNLNYSIIVAVLGKNLSGDNMQGHAYVYHVFFSLSFDRFFSGVGRDLQLLPP